ncbi:hypothetical protein BJX65DRAFT_285352 [Aspergillus insuetus]
MDPPRSNQPKKTRSACDKCHTQKLRCTRKSGHSQCERCLRLNAECRFAPRAKRGSKKPRSPSDSTSTRRKQSTSNQTSIPSTELGLNPGNGLESLPTESWLDSLGLADPIDGTNWGIEPAASAWDVNLDTAWAVTGPGLSFSQNACTMQMDLDPIPCPTTTSIHELANLSIALFELMAKFPSIRDDACTTSDMTAQSTRQALPFMFDELFSLTTHFTNLVEHRLCGIDSTTDEPTILMVRACHSRLTQIYTAIFSMMQRCLQHAGVPPRPRPNGTIVLPTVQLGSLSSPSLHVDFENPLSIGKAFMYMWMVAVFSGQLWRQLADVMRERYVAAGRSLVYTLWKEMGERVEGLLETIDTTKALLR